MAQPVFIPGVHDYKPPHQEQPVETPAEHMQRITAEAEEAARKASTNPSKESQ
jgi:hypothetical protein